MELTQTDVTQSKMNEDDCFMCLKDVGRVAEWHLQCSSCQRKLHYACGLGYAEPVKTSRLAAGKDLYVCPVCLVGSQYNYLHLALERHAALSRDARRVREDPDSDDDASSVGSQEVDTVVEPQPQQQDAAALAADADARREQPVAGDIPPPDSGTGAPGPPARSPTAGAAGNEVLRLRDDVNGGGDNDDNSSDTYTPVVSDHELRRQKRCKGMLYGLKHIPKTVDTLVILDSNGRDQNKATDSISDRVCVRDIGGLCCAATTAALKECTRKYPNIKTVAYGLGTNDHLHRREHPGDKVSYIKELDTASKKVFQNAKITFILPFSAIGGLGADYVNELSAAIADSGVGWKKLIPPSMRGNLAGKKKLHLTKEGKVLFTSWLLKMFSPRPQSPKVGEGLRSGVNQSAGQPKQNFVQASNPGKSVPYHMQYPVLPTHPGSGDIPSSTYVQNSPTHNIRPETSVHEIAYTVASELFKQQQRMMYGYHTNIPPAPIWSMAPKTFNY